MLRTLSGLSLAGLLLSACGGDGTISIAAYVPASPSAASPNDNVFSQGSSVLVQVVRDGKVRREESFSIGDKSGEIGILPFKGVAQVRLFVENDGGVVVGQGSTAQLDLEEDDTGAELGIMVATTNSFAPTTKQVDTTVSQLTSPRVGLSATEIAGGRVILAGGTLVNASGAVLSGEIRDDVEVYDPSSGTYATLTAKLSAPRAFHSATRLEDGRVAFIGGLTNSGGNISTLVTVDILDPSTCGKPFDPTLCSIATVSGAAMQIPRAGQVSLLLSDGSVLIAGGFSQINSNVKTFNSGVEVFSPGEGPTGTFALQGQLSDKRGFAAAVLMPNGKVLITGGRDENSVHASTDVFTPGVGVVPGPEMRFARFGHTATAIGADANVFLMYGGFADLQAVSAVSVADGIDAGLVVLPAPFAITPTGTSSVGDHSAARLANGKVLIMGGSNNVGESQRFAFTFELKTSPTLFLVPTLVDSLEFPRAQATALAHSSGQVMLFGGVEKKQGENNFSTLPNGEVFFPAVEP